MRQQGASGDGIRPLITYKVNIPIYPVFGNTFVRADDDSGGQARAMRRLAEQYCWEAVKDE